MAAIETDEIRGRQRPTGKGRRTSVNVYMTEDMARRLEVRAEVEGRSRSDMAREILEAGLKPTRDGGQ